MISLGFASRQKPLFKLTWYNGLMQKNYLVTCLSCGGHNKASIYPGAKDQFLCDLNTDHEKTGNINIISARYRPTMTWGFECICGNTSLLSRQELPDVEKLVVGSQAAVDKVVASLEVRDEDKFTMKEL